MRFDTPKPSVARFLCPPPTLQPQPVCEQDQLSGCSLCTASHTQRPFEAHHNLDVLPRGSPSLLCRFIGRASQFFASAVISIRQGCNKVEANLQQTCTSPARLISTTRSNILFNVGGIQPQPVFHYSVFASTMAHRSCPPA
jgi:hypothetical protein